MQSASLIFEDKLDNASNFLSWKVRVTFLLEETNLWDIVKDIVPSLVDPQQLATHKKEVKAKVNDHGCHKGSFDPSYI
jgi:predicted oxidoreductase (fatty acid repression mutant protein)